LAGSKGYTGAAYLASAAAVRAGAGLVTLGVPESIYTIAARRHAEVMVRPFASTPKGSFANKASRAIVEFAKTQDVIALGPGLSVHLETKKLVRQLIQKIQKPIILDADGLNALVGQIHLLKACQRRMVLTPHPGEFRRLFGGPFSSNDHERKARAREVARHYQVVVVLKGAKTVVANEKGHVYVNPTGNPGMASGGAGDVLTGIIAAIAGQGFELWDAARAGVFFHSLAGDIAAHQIGEISLKATDIIDYLPQAFKKVLAK